MCAIIAAISRTPTMPCTMLASCRPVRPVQDEREQEQHARHAHRRRAARITDQKIIFCPPLKRPASDDLADQAAAILNQVMSRPFGMLSLIQMRSIRTRPA